MRLLQCLMRTTNKTFESLMHMKKSAFIFAALLAIFSSTSAQNVEGTISSDSSSLKMQWWREARFGMFIHWSAFSVTGGKWRTTEHSGWLMAYEKISRDNYAALANQFNPTKFNAEDWVKLAKDAGQKYIVITAKHHDGFAMFKSNASAYNIVDATPFKRNVLKELAEAARKHGIKLGFYYSQAQDWYHPGGASKFPKWDKTQEGDIEKYVDGIAIPQIKELLENYGDIAVVWWDTPVGMTPALAKKFSAITSRYPNLISNNRLGGGFGGDFATPEQAIPATGFPGQNWEVCMTMNGHFFYNAWDEDWKSTPDLLRKLVDISSKGGNFLLNVGPNAYGEIPPVSQRRLREMGDWLRLNGDSVYGTSASPFAYLPWGRATRRGQTIYLHIFDWPKDGVLQVPLANKISRAHLLVAEGTALKVSQGDGRSAIQLPVYGPDTVDSVLAIEFEGEPIVLPAPSIGKLVMANSSDASSNIRNLTDGEPKFAWKAAKGEKAATLVIDLEVPVEIQAIALVEPWHPWDGVSQNYRLAYFENNEWQEVFSGKTDGTGVVSSFKSVKARKFRLLLENSKTEPALNEFLLFRAL